MVKPTKVHQKHFVGDTINALRVSANLVRDMLFLELCISISVRLCFKTNWPLIWALCLRQTR